MMDEGQLAARLTRELGYEVVVAISDEPLATSGLSAAGREKLHTLNSENRRQEWLCGRRALQRVMRQAEDYTDPAMLAFPHPRYSLTHSHGTAVAVAVLDQGLVGIGIDYEQDRTVRPGIERFFLTQGEREMLTRAQARARGSRDVQLMLQLWTIKEAMFKADPENERRLLKDYPLAGELAFQGEIEISGARLRYTSLMLANGCLAAAVSERL